jgi:dCTP deaminase
MTILPDYQIRKAALHSDLIVPFDNKYLQPASYDTRLAVGFLEPQESQFPLDLRVGARPIDGGVTLVEETFYTLKPWHLVLGSTVERVNIPDNMVGRIEGKSSLARFGIQIHSAGYLDPGFCGNVTLEIVNFWPRLVRLWSGMLIAQLSFEWMSGKCDTPYSSERNHYQHSEGAVASRYEGTVF